jgi:hypothetical protein
VADVCITLTLSNSSWKVTDAARSFFIQELLQTNVEVLVEFKISNTEYFRTSTPHGKDFIPLNQQIDF